MNVSELRASLGLLTKIVEANAERVADDIDAAQFPASSYEFIGFQAYRNVLLKDQPSDEEQILKLLDSMHDALTRRAAAAGMCEVRWKLRPELLCSEAGFRIGCRVKITPTLARPKLVGIGK